jgi:hypothetical protein
MNNRILDIEILCQLCDQGRTYAQGSALGDKERLIAQKVFFDALIMFETMKKAQVIE